MSAQMYNVKTGVVEQVADPQSAILAGSHAPKLTDTFNYYNPEDGQMYQTTGEHIADRLKSGATLETPEMAQERANQQAFGDRPITAAGQGAARMLTFGLSDVAARALGGEDTANAIQQIKERNPGATLTGEVGGIVIPTLLSLGSNLAAEGAMGATTLTRGVGQLSRGLGTRFGEALAGEAAKDSTRAVVSRLSGRLAGSAIEGAFYGAGRSISEAALGEPTNVGENLVVGGVTGLGLQGLFEGLSGLAGSNVVRSGLAHLATFGGEESGSSFYKFLENSQEGAARRELIKGGVGMVDELKRKAIDIATSTRELGQQASDFFKGSKFANIGDLLGNMPHEEALAAGQNVQKQIMDTLNELQARPGMYTGPSAGKLEDIANDLALNLKNTKSPAEVFKAIDDAKSALWKAGKAGGAPTASEAAAINKVRDLTAAIKGSLEDEGTWGNAAALQQKLNGAYSEFQNAQKAFQQNFMRKYGEDMVVDPQKVSTFLKKAFKPEGALKAQAFEDYVNAANGLREQLAQAGTHEGVAEQNGLREGLEKIVDQFKDLSEFGRASNVLGHIPVLSELSPQRVAKTLGLIERGVNGLNTQWMRELGSTMKNLSSSEAASATSDEDKSQFDYQLHLAQLAQLANSPERLAEVLKDKTVHLAGSAPQITKAVQQTLSQGIQYLYQNAPKNPNANFLGDQSAAENWKPSASDMARYQRILSAAQDPMNLLRELRSGTLSAETVNTVKTLYPNFYGKTVSGLAQYVAEKKVELPYQRQLQLSLALGMPVHPTMVPSTIQAFQASHNQAQQQAQAQAQAASAKFSAIKTAAENSMTPGQATLSSSH